MLSKLLFLVAVVIFVIVAVAGADTVDAMWGFAALAGGLLLEGFDVPDSWRGRY